MRLRVRVVCMRFDQGHVFGCPSFLFELDAGMEELFGIIDCVCTAWPVRWLSSSGEHLSSDADALKAGCCTSRAMELVWITNFNMHRAPSSFRSAQTGRQLPQKTGKTTRTRRATGKGQSLKWQQGDTPSNRQQRTMRGAGQGSSVEFSDYA